MRFVSALFAFAVLAALAGCGSNAGSGEPAQLTAEQEQQLKEERQKADAEERSHMAAERGSIAPTAADEERLHRDH